MPDMPEQPLPLPGDNERTLALPDSGAPPVSPVPAAGNLDADEGLPFGDYELHGELGRGGMGVVYRARERQSGRLLALKMMLHEKAPASAELRRFRLEARAAGQLNHPGIVAIHSWGEHEGHLFYTMDFVPGVPLNRLMERGPLRADQAVRYLVGIARAASAAHAQGIVHRDLKPSNVIIDPNDQPRVLDFGLARRQRPMPGEVASVESIADVVAAEGQPTAQTVELTSGSRAPDTDSRVSRATRQGAILGTPSYMAPEQARGEHDRVGPPTDVHALGAILYEMLLGRPPFQGGSVMDTLQQVREREPAPMWLEGKRVPAVLEAVCRRCLQKQPGDRYADAGALADALEKNWERARQAKRDAWLALVCGSAGALLLGSRLALARWANHTAWSLADHWFASAGPATAEAATVLAVLLDGIFFLGTPLLALLIALVALARWARNGWLGRLLSGSEQVSAEPAAVQTEPFLHRLFAAGVETRPSKAVRATQTTVAVADIEPGKVVHQWDGGLVRRGRQKSLDRPVLVWLDTTPAAPDAPLPGVYVRHPAVLVLHAVGASPEGRFLVTELMAGTPLSEVLQHDRPEPEDAVLLISQLARAVQAIHDQGACLGVLRPERILVSSDLGPVICPWFVPAQTAEDRIRDCQSLGRLLQEWLPTRPLRWQRQPFGILYEVCEAAVQGKYARPADWAADLDLAGRQVATRRRNQWVTLLVVVLAALPWLLLVGEWLRGRQAPVEGAQPETSRLTEHLLLALAPCAVLLGYTHARALIQRVCLRFSASLSVRKRHRFLIPVQLALLVVPPGLVSWQLGTGWLGAGLLLGFWLLGMCLAGLLALGGQLFRNVQQSQVRSDPLSTADNR